MDAIISFCGLCTLLVIGKALRTAIPLLQRLYLPSSVIGGLVGACLFCSWIKTMCSATGPLDGMKYLDFSSMSYLPRFFWE